MSPAKYKKSRFTASVNESVVAKVDEYVAKLRITRSDIVEEAMEEWLKAKLEDEEEQYFASAAAEMNADAKSWNVLTSKATREGQNK